MRSIAKVSDSNLATHHGDFIIHVYRDLRNAAEHVALVKGEVAFKDNVLVRVHSECLTGDIFASKRCDCGEQLQLAQQKIAEAGRGVIIYLRNHEGRGIGLANKIRAYDLQDKGRDTVEANLELGLPVDKRTFEVAADIIEHLQINSVSLMTNNPAKITGLHQLGVLISNTQLLKVKPNSINQHYISTKQIKLGHF